MEEKIINVMDWLADGYRKELINFKKLSMKNIEEAKSRLQSWWDESSDKNKMRVLSYISLNFDSPKIGCLEVKARVLLAAILIIRQIEEDYLPE